MQSMADMLADAGVVTKDQAQVAKGLSSEIKTVELQLNALRKRENSGSRALQLSGDEREKLRVLEARLRILKRTKVLG